MTSATSTKYKVDLDKKDLNQDQGYQQALKYNSIAAQEAINQGISAAQQMGNTNAQTYQDKANIDSATKLRDASLAQAFNKGGAVGQKGASAFGNWFGSDFKYGGGASAAGNDRALRDYNFQRDQAANSARAISKAEAAGELAKMDKQGIFAQQSAGMQNAYDLQKAKIGFEQATKEAALDRVSKEKLAGIQAQGSIFSSLLGSVGSGNPNYKFWG